MKTKSKKKKVKGWAVIREDIMNWAVLPLTGALAIFDNRNKALEAVAYNKKLMKIVKSTFLKQQYKVVPCEITFSLPSPKSDKRK